MAKVRFMMQFRNDFPDRRGLRAVFLVLLTALLIWIQAGMARAENSAVVFMYHRFADDEYPSTSVTLNQFEAHIRELTSGGYTVLPLDEVISALKTGRALPDRTVALTIDDAFRSIYEIAWPRLKAAGLPFTVFVSTDPVDRGLDDYMTWDQLRELKAAGVHLQPHSLSHGHMPSMPLEKALGEITGSRDRMVEMLGIEPTLFAFPYGEASQALMDGVRKAGFEAAFGQHSGTISRHSNIWYLPRFSLNTRYGDMDRFRLSANSVGLPVTDLTPANPLLGPGGSANPPALGFTLAEPVARAREMACYHSQVGRVENMEWLGERRVELRFDKPFPAGRTRINCTVPAGDGRWYWFGHQFYRAP